MTEWLDEITNRNRHDKVLIGILKILILFQVFNFKVSGVPIDYFMILFGFISYSFIRVLGLNRGWYLALSFYVLFGFVLFLCATSLWSDYALFTLNSAARFLVILCFLMLVINLRNIDDIHALLSFYVKCVLILCLFSIFHIFWGSYDFYGRFLFSIMGERGDPNFAAFILIISAFTSYYLKIYSKIYSWYAFLFTLLFLFTFSRGGLLSLVVTFFAVILLYFIKYGLDRRLFKLTLVGSFAGFSAVTLLAYAYFNFYENLSEVFRFKSLVQGAGRKELLLTVFERISSDWLVGLGFNTFILDNEVLFENGRLVSMATHNSYLEFLYGGGIVGLFMFVLFQTLVFTSIMSRKFYKEANKRFHMYILASFMFCVFSMFLINIETHRLLWLIIGLAMVLGRKKNLEEYIKFRKRNIDFG